jgi:outer membrane protein assembly factor BamA
MICRLRRVRRALLALAVVWNLVFAALPAQAAPSAPIVVSVDVSGNLHVPTDRILSVVRTKPGQPFDEATLREDLQAIFDLGYFSDQVPPLIRQRPDGIAITFRVIENPVINRITFSGNDSVPSDTLLALMDTASGQVFNTSTFHQDVLKINSYYDKIGFQGQLPSHVIGVNVAKDGTLALQIREGLTVAAIEIDGMPYLAKQLIIDSLSLKIGKPYSEDQRDKDFDNVKKLYEKYDLQLGDFEAGIDPSTVNLEKGTATVKYTIYAMIVGAVQITGNTITKDNVIRRQLHLRPGMLVTQGLLRRDYERLNNLGFFEKVDLNTKPGPNPKKPYEITLDWNVKEQRTGTAQIGAGYSGGPNGEGLTGTLSYSQNNINGTGNSSTIRFERGARVADASISLGIPYLGDSPASQKYSLGASIFTNNQINYYQVYQASSAQAVAPNPIISTPAPGGGGSSGSLGTIPVILTPNSNVLSGISADYATRSNGLSASVGRRLNDTLTASVGVTIERIATDVGLPAPYYLAGTQTTILNSPTTSNPFGQTNNGSTLGIQASSIANTSNGQGNNLRSVTFGLQQDSRDDVFNPRRGVLASLSEEVSVTALGSNFQYTITTLDVAKFYPVFKNSTFGLHFLGGYTTGAIPPNKLFLLSDQQLRGYSQVFYGTEEGLGQAELRYPLTADRKFNLAFFTDYGIQRIRGAVPLYDQFGNVVANYNDWYYYGDVGAGIRFDLPQLGFRSIRLDFARGANSFHTSFGVGQSF